MIEQPAVVAVVKLETLKELSWFKEALESGRLLYPIAGELTLPELRLNAGGTNLFLSNGPLPMVVWRRLTL